MTTFDALAGDRRRLILHRVTRAVAEKMQREDHMSLFAFSYMEATIHRINNVGLGPEELRKCWGQSNDALTVILRNVQTKRGFDFHNIVSTILKEEGIAKPTEGDTISVALCLAAEGFA